MEGDMLLPQQRNKDKHRNKNNTDYSKTGSSVAAWL